MTCHLDSIPSNGDMLLSLLNYTHVNLLFLSFSANLALGLAALEKVRFANGDALLSRVIIGLDNDFSQIRHQAIT